ncbi:MAG: response regulator [Azoarcus sp.]|jgi:signal transduction histidine kinase/FixJ family two-component response regulator/HPt (histidine-containing phosphotransfer) domain-containing protein|nr:response regulator [Azoarcus sp.]
MYRKSKGEYLDLLLDNTPNIVFMLDEHGIVDYCCSLFVRELGLQSTDEIVGKHFTDIYRLFGSEQLLADAQRVFDEIRISGVAQDSELKMDFSGKGKPRAYNVQSLPLFDRDGHFRGAYVHFVDVGQLRLSMADRYGRLLLDALPISCSLRDADHSIVYGNQKMLDIFNADSVEEVNANFRAYDKILQPDGEESGQKAATLFAAAEREGACSLRWTYKTLEGDPLPLETEIVRVPWQGGWRLACFSRDLREDQKQAARIHAAERRVQAMFDATPLCVFIIDSNCRLLDCNEEAVRTLKAPSKAYVIEHMLKDLSAETQDRGLDSATQRKQNLQVARAKGIYRGFWTYRTVDGEPIPAEVIYVRIPWGDEHYIAIYARDLREIQAKEREARNANELLELMFDALNCGSCVWDEDLNLVDCNRKQIEQFGCRDKRELMENFYELSPPTQPDGESSKEKSLRLVKRAFQTGHEDFFWEHYNCAGDVIPTEISLRRVKWQGGWRVISSTRSLSDIRKAEARNIQLEVENRSVREAAAMKSNFLASMSHEIRTPMNAIVGLADLIRVDNLDAKQREFIQNIRGMSHVLLQIINDVLDYSKIDAGKFTLAPTDYSIRRVLDSVGSLTRATIGDKPLTFRSRIDDDVPDTLYGDEVRVQQILFNILNNAVKYTLRGGIDLHVGREVKNGKDYLVIVIADTGIGIREEDLPHLFDRFAQFDSHKNRNVSGTGLGLPITREIVSMMAGELVVESEYGMGTTFKVYLPIVAGDPEKVKHNETAMARVVATPDARVLVVDDSEINLAVALGYLSRHGIQAETAASGVEAVAKIAAEPFDLVFMDHMMPEMDGVEATREIRAMQGGRYRDLPIIALTANAIAGVREGFLEAGMNDFIGKPIDPRELNAALLRWLLPEKRTVSEADTIAPRHAHGDPFAVLDREAALDRVEGDEELYRKLACVFPAAHADDPAQAAAMLAAGDLKGARRVAHTLKSAAATLGAMRLSRAAAAVEAALADDATPVSADDEALRVMADELASALEELRRYNAANEVQAPATPFDAERALALLERLEPLLAKGSFECLALAEEIDWTVAALGESGRAFAAALGNFDWPTALKTLTALRDAIAEQATPGALEEKR